MSLQAVDFLRPAAIPKLAWWLLGAGVIALAAALWCDSRWADERAEAQRVAESKAEAWRARQVVKPRAPPASERRLQQAQKETSRPWLPALRAIEFATQDPVYLLSLSTDAATGNLKLEAEAPNFEHALAYVQVLGDGSALSPASLQSHEQALDPATGRRMVRFTVLTQWIAH